MAQTRPEAEACAAGGLLWRRSAAGEVEVLVVHRPRYDDWSFAKGKCDPGETFEQTAEREVLEETGFSVAFGAELDEVRYTDHKGRSKLVRYWAMTVTGGAFTPHRPDGVVDLSGIVKARAIESAGDVLVAHGHLDWCLNAGGDVLVSGTQASGQAWTVGIVDPDDRGRLWTQIATRPGRMAVATSGVQMSTTVSRKSDIQRAKWTSPRPPMARCLGRGRP